MNISIGIVGLPNVGKSTLFNAATKKQVPAENFPFCTIDPSVGVVPVPDERLGTLGKISSSKDIIPTTIEFVDIAGLVRGASKGEGLGNSFLSHIREVDAIAHVVRCFIDDDITHVEGEINPKRDIDIIETELLLADVQIAEKRLQRLEKDVRSGDADAAEEEKLIKSALESLNKGHLLLSNAYIPEQNKKFDSLGFLTQKPILYICNVGDKYDENAVNEVKECADRIGANVVCVSVHTEMELSQLEPSDAASMRQDLLEEKDGIDIIIQTAYKTLNLISFFTTGEKETRAWSVTSGSTAPQAGRVIHSDFETKFIRAEVVAYDDFVSAGSVAKTREQGKFRLEGKGYIVKDGDVIVFRHG